MIRVAIEIGFSFKHELEDERPSLLLPAGADVRRALVELAGRYPAIADRLLDRAGTVRRHINVLVNGGNISGRRGWETELADGDRLTILPPVGGG